MEGFEDQPRIASLCLEALSFALTLKAISTIRTVPKIAAWIGAIVSGWAYLALVDFGIGMEFFRLLCVFILIGQNQAFGSFIKRCTGTVRAWAIAGLAPAGFLFWRVFIFHNERPQTDIGRQLGVLVGLSFVCRLPWLIRPFQSTLDVALLSWVTPALQDFFGMRLRDIAFDLVMAGLAAACVYLAYTFLKMKKVDEEDRAGAILTLGAWPKQAIWIGLIGVIMGVLPVIMANRYVDFQSYSHYALPGLIGRRGNDHRVNPFVQLRTAAYFCRIGPGSIGRVNSYGLFHASSR